MSEPTEVVPVLHGEGTSETPCGHGHPEPWSYGPYRVVIQRRVTEEEQISVECYEPTREKARETFDNFMDAMNAHRVNYNDNVVMVAKGKLAQLDRLIEGKAEELQDLEQQVAALQEKRQALALEDNGCARPEPN